MPSYLITGAGRGLGLGFAVELLKNDKNVVIATARNTASSSGLQELKSKPENANRLLLVDLDVSNVDSISAAAEKTAQLLPAGTGVDYLISNAGVMGTGMESFEEMNLDDLAAEIKFTVSAPINLLRGFLPLVRQGQEKKVVFITSSLGSVTQGFYTPGLVNGYSVARAALNMVGRKWSATLKNEGIALALVHPGWSGATEIGSGITEYMNKYAPHVPNLTVEESAQGCVKVFNGLKAEDAGAFFNVDGTPVPF